MLVLFCFFSVGLPHRFNDVRGGPLRGERAPHLQRKHAGYKGHRGIPQTGGTEVPARCPGLVIGKGAGAKAAVIFCCSSCCCFLLLHVDTSSDVCLSSDLFSNTKAERTRLRLGRIRSSVIVNISKGRISPGELVSCPAVD